MLLRRELCRISDCELCHISDCVSLQGYGLNSVKTSTTPQEVKPLDGVYIYRVASGWGHVLLLARNDTEEERAKLDDLPDYVP